MAGISGNETQEDWILGGASLSAGQRARWTLGDMVGRSAAMERLFLQMRYLATHLRVGLIEGESGTGKRMAIDTLVHLALHRASTPPRAPLSGQTANRCLLQAPAQHALQNGTLQPGLLALDAETATDAAPDAPSISELPVYTEEASAFLGRAFTEQEMEARFSAMRCHLLYLRNVDRLDALGQQRLLQLVDRFRKQRAAVSRVHADALGFNPNPISGQIPVSGPVALLAGSRSDLRGLVTQQVFRSDLYRQLAAVRLELPPLRQRPEDIPMLVERFLTLVAGERHVSGQTPMIAREALSAVQSAHWPGNIAALRHALEQAWSRASAGRLEMKHFQGILIYEPGTQAVVSRSAILDRARNGSSLTQQPALASPAAPYPGKAAVDPLARHPARPMASGRNADFNPGFSGADSLQRRDTLGDALANRVCSAGGTVAGTHKDGYPELVVPGKTAGSTVDLADANLDRAILRHISSVLQQCQGNKLRAARLLGISRSTLYRLMQAEWHPDTASVAKSLVASAAKSERAASV